MVTHPGLWRRRLTWRSCRRVSLTPSIRRVSLRRSLQKKAGCSQSVVLKYLEWNFFGREHCGRTSIRYELGLERLIRKRPFQTDGDLHKEWTEAGLCASRVTTHRFWTWASHALSCCWSVAQWPKCHLFWWEPMMNPIRKSMSQTLDEEWRGINQRYLKSRVKFWQSMLI